MPKSFRRIMLAILCGTSLLLTRAQGAPAPTTPVLQNTAGKVVVLDFWASWCGPCRKSFPWMNALQKKYGPQGLVIVAVNVDAKRSDADAFLKAVPAEFRIEYDPKGELAGQMNVAAMPTSFVIDRSGNIIKQHAGFREAQMADREAELQQLLEVKSR